MGREERCRTLRRRSGEGERDAPAPGRCIDLLYAAPLPPLRIRPAFDLNDIQREVDHRRVCYRAPDAEGVDDVAVGHDILARQTPREEDLHVRVAVDVELPAHLLDDRPHIPPPGPRRIQPDRRRPARRRPDRLDLLVGEGIAEHDPRHLRARLPHKRPPGILRLRVAHHKRVRHRARERDPRRGTGVARRVHPADPGRPLDHCGDRRVLAPRAEREDRTVPCSEPDVRRSRRHP